MDHSLDSFDSSTYQKEGNGAVSCLLKALFRRISNLGTRFMLGSDLGSDLQGERVGVSW